MDLPHQDLSSTQPTKTSILSGLTLKSLANTSLLIFHSQSKKDSSGQVSTGLKTMTTYLP